MTHSISNASKNNFKARTNDMICTFGSLITKKISNKYRNNEKVTKSILIVKILENKKEDFNLLLLTLPSSLM
ncbi:hypothetical protein Q4Q68_19795, partial [Morganella morganii]